MPSLSYYSNIPNVSNNPANDVPLMQTNSASLQTLIDVDHVDFSNNNYGKHSQVTMPVQAAIPSGRIGLTGTVYTKTVATYTANNESTLFYTPDTSGNEYQLTRTIAAKGASFGTNPGWTFLPGGLLFQFGNITLGVSSNTAVVFPVAFVSSVYSVVNTLLNGTNYGYSVNSVTLSGFNFNVSPVFPSGTGYWYAIGK